MTRKEKQKNENENTAAFFTVKTALDIWGTNSTLVEKKVTLEVTSFDLDSDWTDKWTKDVVLLPNSSTEIWKGDLPGQPTRTKYSQVPEVIVVSSRLLDADGTVLARYSNWYVRIAFDATSPLNRIVAGLSPSSTSNFRMSKTLHSGLRSAPMAKPLRFP